MNVRRHGERVAVIDRDQAVTYVQIDQRSTRLALNLLDEGLKPLDRVVVQLPNVVEFVYLYFALQKIGAIPIMALPTHRFREMSQFIELSGAVACATPDQTKDFDYRELVRRIRPASKTLSSGNYPGRCASRVFLSARAHRAAQPAHARDCKIAIDTEDPALFQLSGGTTGIPKLIPRSHNDYVYNSKMAAAVTGVGPDG